MIIVALLRYVSTPRWQGDISRVKAFYQKEMAENPSENWTVPDIQYRVTISKRDEHSLLIQEMEFKNYCTNLDI
jgi:hypothetical protein